MRRQVDHPGPAKSADGAIGEMLALPGLCSLAKDFVAVAELFLGRVDNAVALLRRGRDLDPLSSRMNGLLGEGFELSRRYDDAIAAMRVAMELDPKSILARQGLYPDGPPKPLKIPPVWAMAVTPPPIGSNRKTPAPPPKTSVLPAENDVCPEALMATAPLKLATMFPR